MTSGRGKQAGFTLLELLIAATMSLLVVSVATAFYQRTIRENQKIKDSAMMHERAFFASHLMSQHLRQAGFKGIDETLLKGRMIPIPDNAKIFPAVDATWAQGQFLKADAASISFRFNGSSTRAGVADGSIIDCSGNAVPAGTILESSIALIDGRIVCTSAGVEEPLLGSDETLEVADLDIRLGVDDSGNGSIDRYVVAASASDADLEITREVLLRVLMVSHQKLDALGRQYRHNNTQVDYPDNRYRREVVVRTAFRNL